MGWITDHLSILVADAILSFFAGIFEESVQWLGELLVGIMSMAQTVLDYPIVVQGILYAQGIAFVLLAVKVALESLQTWILYSSGDPEADPRGLLISTVKAAAIIASIPWLVRWLYMLGSTMALEISHLSGVGFDPADFSLIFLGAYIVRGSFIIILAALVSLVLIIVIYIQTFIRAATLGMLAVIGPILAIQEVGSDGGLFRMWLKELTVVCFSQAIQIFMILGAVYAMSNILFGDNPVTAAMMFLGWLWATMKAPGTLKQMLYSSGVGSVAGGAAQTAGTMVIVRKMMTRGV